MYKKLILSMLFCTLASCALGQVEIVTNYVTITKMNSTTYGHDTIAAFPENRKFTLNSPFVDQLKEIAVSPLEGNLFTLSLPSKYTVKQPKSDNDWYVTYYDSESDVFTIYTNGEGGGWMIRINFKEGYITLDYTDGNDVKWATFNIYSVEDKSN